MKKIFILLFGVAAYIYSQSTAPVLIPMTDKATYDFIDYLNTSGVIDIEFTGMKPYRTDEIYKKLTKIKDADNKILNFIQRFEEEYIQKENKFGTVGSKNTTAWFDPYVNQSYISQKAVEAPLYIYHSAYSYLANSNADRGYAYPDISQNVTDGGLKGYFGYKEFLSLSTNSGVMLKHGYEYKLRDEYETLVLVPSGGEADFSSEDHTETSLLLSGDDIQLSIGKYPLSLGAGNMHSLTLSSQEAFYENFIFSIASDRVKFSTVTGFLLADYQTRHESSIASYQITNLDTASRVDYIKREKYLSAHRLEWRALDNLSFGVNEMVIMGDRTIEMGYALPVLPLFWMGHYYGDHDNSLISFDLKYKPFKNFSFFSELLFDDETFTESWTKNYMNKWAISTGLTNTNFLTINGLTFDFEYARIEPYVYGHKYHINRYMHLDNFIGMPSGPDSEMLDYKLKYFFDFDKNISVGYTRTNRGEPIWGYWDAPMSYKIDNKVFLRGTVEKSNYYFADLEYRYNKFISINIFYSHTDIMNYNHNLPRYDETWIEDYNDTNSDADPLNDYLGYQDYYEKEIEPSKVKQVYSNNTFALKLNLVFKNYFRDIF
ncbi:MAG: hypothetical protein JXR69_01385 [Candidatus Delongbacteria bacterium]|nr:hypothetical protein [Candidatus Delongbacteria bacterium]